MDIVDLDFEELLTTVRRLKQCADELLEVRSKLVIYKKRIDASWEAVEAVGIHDAVNQLNMQINRTSDEIDDISMDIIEIYEELLEGGED